MSEKGIAILVLCVIGAVILIGAVIAVIALSKNNSGAGSYENRGMGGYTPNDFNSSYGSTDNNYESKTIETDMSHVSATGADDICTIAMRSLKDGSSRMIRLSDKITIGRGESCGFVISDPAVSGTHAELSRIGKSIFIKDLYSKNGTFLNGERISQEAQLKDGDVIMLGRSEYRLQF